MRHYRVNEIFYSLQGEGFHSGTPALFVRFSGCNLACPFCDTDFASYEEMTAGQIIARAREVLDLSDCGVPLVVLTGGEPSLQVDTELCSALKDALGAKICMETNGTCPFARGIDWITCSPKEGSRVVLDQADEVKVVFTGQDVEHWHTAIRARHYFLQPCSCGNTAEVIAYILAHPHWRLSLQMHKYTGIR